MMIPDYLHFQLHSACRLAGAKWALFLFEDTQDGWRFLLQCGANPARDQAIRQWLELDKNRDWLAGALITGRQRSQKTRDPALDCAHLYLFPNPTSRILLLAGADKLGKKDRHLFQLLNLPDWSEYRVPAAQDWKFLRETSMELADLELETVFSQAVNRAQGMLEASGAEIGLCDEKEQVLRILKGQDNGDPVQQYTIPFNAETGRQLAREGKAVTWHRSAPAGEHPGHAVLGVPLQFRGQIIGALIVSDRDAGREYSPDDLFRLEWLAAEVAVAIRNARLVQELGERIKAARVVDKKIVETTRLAALGEMAASIAHELNNPLTTITGFTELVVDDLPGGAPQRDDLELVLREARRAREVVRRLLDYSRKSEGRRVSMDINEVLSDVVSLVLPLAQSQGIEIQFEPWDALPGVMGDRNQIKQVLLNLINNGLQAMPGGGTMLIQTSLEKRSGRGWVTIHIEDTGEGISEEVIDQIFDPFFTTKPVGSGTGLGLSISHNLVTEHGGSIEVKSEVGAGTHFIVWLPVQKEEGSGDGPNRE